MFDAEIVEACRKIWKNDVPTKVSILTWRLLLNKLPTRMALQRRGVLSSSHDLCCVLCFEEEETSSHLFSTCTKRRRIWEGVHKWLGSGLTAKEDLVSDFIQFGSVCKNKKSKGRKQLIWMATVWSIWTSRNRIIFKGETHSVSSIIMNVKHLSWGRFIARSGRNSRLSLSDWINCPLGCLYSF